VKKGYSGVAIYARQKPMAVTKSLGFDTADNEGRYVRFDYDNLQQRRVMPQEDPYQRLEDQ